MDSIEASIVLNMLSGMGPVRLRRLLDIFETPERILIAREDELKRAEGVGPEVARAIRHWEESVDLAAELKAIEAADVTVLTKSCPNYPPLLREIYDPPIVLYCRGKILEKDRHAIGIVGTRKPSHYALECSKKLSYQLAYSGLTVVSGLARGIDTSAHQGALAAKGRTIAVIGSGLNALYPAENAALADKIADGSGAVITEFPMNRKADKQTFPMRNRIISGCSFGLLVVEAAFNSGALISANQATEQGRTLYSIPGRIDNPGAFGSNRLIQQGAKLVMDAKDILDDMNMLFRDTPELNQSKPTASLNEVEEKIYTAIGDEPTGLDQIVTASGLPTGTVSSTLLTLEMRRLVKQLPGTRFVKLI
ncbi:MAG: DNA-processing protein DprA [Chthoniobacterales bacterium]